MECHPLSTLPGTSRLFRDFAEAVDPATVRRLREWYPTPPFGQSWPGSAPELSLGHRDALASELLSQARLYKAGAEALENIEKLRGGAAAVVTGQQVGLFGGPLLTLLKAATAVRQAQDATRISGREHVPVFWMATEDHDVAEVDQLALPAKGGVTTLKAGLGVSGVPVPVGLLPTGAHVGEALATAEELLQFAPVCDVLRDAYTNSEGYTATLASGMGRLLSNLFAEQGLVVLDASSRGLHELGRNVLHSAIEDAEALEQALIERSAELEQAGYHAQVKVAPEMSLLFLVSLGVADLPERKALRRTREGQWKAGSRIYTREDLLEILAHEPERLSPNALLRPVFQDAILPTAAYIGGPAEIAYFAQSAVVYEKVLGRITPVLPRLSATLIEPSIAHVLAQHELHLPEIMKDGTVDDLTVRLGARAMPIEAKRRLAATGNAMDAELGSLLEYLETLNPELARSAGVSASKMRYQMNRLRRMAARFESERESSLRKHAIAIITELYPERHLQERLLGGVWFAARWAEDLIPMLVEHAGLECPGHRVLVAEA